MILIGDRSLWDGLCTNRTEESHARYDSSLEYDPCDYILWIVQDILSSCFIQYLSYLFASCTCLQMLALSLSVGLQHLPVFYEVAEICEPKNNFLLEIYFSIATKM